MLTIDDFPASTRNYSLGREAVIDQAVLHTMVGTIASARTTFQSGSLRQPRSAHYGIAIDGSHVESYVPVLDTAWHAGNWEVNCRAIGYEHEDLGFYDDPRPMEMYATSAALLARDSQRFNIPLVRISDPSQPGVMPHRVAVATHCPGTLDVDLIIGMARGEAGVFNPRENPADLAFLDQRIREIVMGEDIAAYALYVALGRYTGNLPKTVRAAMERARRARPTKIVRRKRVPASKVRAGHGRG